MGCCSSTAADVARQRQQREIAANGLRDGFMPAERRDALLAELAAYAD